MNCAPELTFPIPLVSAAHDLAEDNCKRTSTRHAKQLYLRTLAAYAVHYYFNCLGIAAEYGSDMTNPKLFALSRSVDVLLPELGSVECLVVVSDAEMVEVPPEVWGDRIAYIAVQLDESLRTATLIGYLKSVADGQIDEQTDEQIPVNRFRQHSIESLLAYLDHLRNAHHQGELIRQVPVRLSQWFNNVFEHGWQVLEQSRQLLEANLDALQPAYRSSHSAHRHGLKSVMGQKILDLKPSNTQLELALGLIPSTTDEFEVWVGIYPTGSQTHLPIDLQVMILNELSEPVMQQQAKSTENLRFQFSGETGEQFSVCLRLGDVSVTEAFVI